MLEGTEGKGYHQTVDITPERAIEDAIKEIKEKGWRQVIIVLTSPGKPPMTSITAGLTVSEQYRLLSCSLHDIIQRDLGPLPPETKEPV